MYNDDNNNNNNSSGGNRGKFSERIKRILRYRNIFINKISFFNFENSPLLNVGKIILAIPSVVYSNIRNNENKNLRENIGNLKLINLNNDKNSKLDIIKSIDVDLLKKNSVKSNFIDDKKNLVAKLPNDGNNNLLNENNCLNIDYVDNNNKQESKEKLQKDIINMIENRLTKCINEFEILQSEFYILDKLDCDDVYFEKCNHNIKEIKKLLLKIKYLREKYEYLKENNDFQYSLDYGDDLLIDKIIDLKNIYDEQKVYKSDVDFEILDEYKYLYLKIYKLEDDFIEYEKKKVDRIEKLKNRDINFEKLKEKVFDFEKINEEYIKFVNEQDFLLKTLEEKISHIDKYEKISYRLKVLNHLVANSFKYIGLLMLNPLKGLIPGIVSQTLITKNLIHNIYSNMEFEEDKKIVFEAIDYSASINAAINSIDNTAKLIDSTLDEISELKNKYITEFSKYETSFSSYKKIIRKLDKIEKVVLSSKIKINIL